MFLINRGYNMVMNQRRSLFGENANGRVESDFFLVASIYFVKEDYLMKQGNPVI